MAQGEPGPQDPPDGGRASRAGGAAGPAAGQVAERTSVGAEFATRGDIVLLAGVMLAFTVGIATTLVQAWPPPAAATDPVPERAAHVRILFWTPGLLRDARLFLVVLTAGGLGALIHTLRSLYEYVGNRRLKRSWVLMYTLEPFVGAVLALVVYLVLRGGLTTTMASSAEINPYGVAAVAALVGMFSRQTVQKLLAVFDTLLAPAEQTSDRMRPEPARPEPARHAPAPDGPAQGGPAQGGPAQEAGRRSDPGADR
ncbi:hypothetical protein GCM10010129_29220 [Streptomyces fumigatiscleroticus]|nr:hypothetical protein GCM10010129_29220 [Streptomyces fumigatiscleroticus]